MNSPVSKLGPHTPALVIGKDLVFSISDGATASFRIRMTPCEARSVALLLATLADEREGLAGAQCLGSA